ncbi:nitrate reductase molybdenum cofactor assembly chaperone [Nocardia sp. NPDC088792]|uniref:nitrate reductase molybdenum cofactor assembly chaperone n=1 Tax=Nocardia sp. NPDC088792 TaxID=3364332 RepID=UPI00380FD715
MKLSAAQRSAAWQVQSLLLGYPDAQLLDALPLLRRTAEALPAAVGAPLQPLLTRLASAEPLAVATEYVDTFDHRKRFSPYLTWFMYGNTRKRGMGLLRLEEFYRAAGLVLGNDELSDHLSVMLEFASAHPGLGQQLLEEYRAGIEFMRMALRDADSPWTGVLESVSATLAPLRGSERDAVARLIAAGPPDEGVGLEPFGPPSHMPEMPQAPAMLGMPEPIGGRR